MDSDVCNPISFKRCQLLNARRVSMTIHKERIAYHFLLVRLEFQYKNHVRRRNSITNTICVNCSVLLWYSSLLSNEISKNKQQEPNEYSNMYTTRELYGLSNGGWRLNPELLAPLLTLKILTRIDQSLVLEFERTKGSQVSKLNHS